MERADTDVSSLACCWCGWTGLLTAALTGSDIGSGNYEAVEGQTLPGPVTNYGATGR